MKLEPFDPVVEDITATRSREFWEQILASGLAETCAAAGVGWQFIDVTTLSEEPGSALAIVFHCLEHGENHMPGGVCWVCRARAREATT